MNKNTLLLCFTMLFSYTVSAQAFTKGGISIDLGYGFGIYGQSIKNETNSDDEEGSGAALSGMVPIVIEYGITNKVGTGLEIGYSSYVIGDDDGSSDLSSVNTFDFSLMSNFHLLKADKNDLLVGFSIGYNIGLWDVSNTNSSISSNGITYALNVKDRIFFGDHFGMYVSMGYRGYSNNIKLTDEFGSEDNFKWNLNGFNTSLGLAVKF